MLKKAKKSRRNAATSSSQTVVRAVQSEGSPSSSSGAMHSTPHLGVEVQLSHGKSTPDELHTAANNDDDEEADAFLWTTIIFFLIQDSYFIPDLYCN